MLFQRIYNWIKYKTLPPSFLFRNRLFIERDSKHRRIFSNFGLSFRNSKWSNYETYNIKINFKSYYYKFVTWSISFFIVIYFFVDYNQFYLFHYIYNHLWFFFWICGDTTDYFFAYLIWATMFALSFSLNFIYSYLFFNNFSNNAAVEKVFSSDLVARIHAYPFPPNRYYISKNDTHRLINTWLVHVNGRESLKVMKKIFESNVGSRWWYIHYNFFLRAYRSAIVLNLTTKKQDTFITCEALAFLSDLYLRSQPFAYSTHQIKPCYLLRYLRTCSWFRALTNKSYKKKKYVEFSFSEHLKRLPDPNVYDFNVEMEKLSFLIRTKAGLFFFTDFDYKKFSHLTSSFYELGTLHSFIKNQLAAAKWNRWLYRYSILHRKILKNSHKLTLSKRLLNSGIYDSKFFDKNIWNSEYLGKNFNSQIFTNLFNSYYSDDFKIKNKKNYTDTQLYLNDNKTREADLNTLGFYEYSYFWFLKRFYLFNTLPNNFIKSALKINENYLKIFLNSADTQINDYSNYSLALSYLLKSQNTAMAPLSYSSDRGVSDIYKNFSVFSNFNNFNLKNSYLLINENDILSRDHLTTLLYLTGNFTKNNNLIFFNYALKSFCFTSYSGIKFLKNKNLYNFNLWLLYSLKNNDKFYLNDIAYLTLFY